MMTSMGIVTIIVRREGKERVFRGISEEDVRMKIDGYLKRCDYQGRRGVTVDKENRATIIL